MLLCGCSRYKEVNDIIFGTSVSVTADKGDINGAIEIAKQLDSKLSVNIETSLVSRINSAAGTDFVQADEDVMQLIEDSLYYNTISGGNFDITVLPLVRLWGIGTANPRCPSDKEIQEAVKLCGSENILIEDGKIKLKKEGCGIDLGGIAKGYAADRMAEYLSESGCSSAVINLGGNIRLIGSKEDSSDWKIGIQDPDSDTGEYLGYVTVSDKSIATSGDYQRYFIKNGVRYHHIIDPHTGRPAETDIRSVTVISNSAEKSDALSTIAFMAGSEKAVELIERTEGTDAVIVTKNHTIILTSNAKSYFTLTNADKYNISDKKR